MSRLVSEHFKRDGSPKRAYPDKALALAAVGKSREHVYRCKFCGAWHRAKDRVARAAASAPTQSGEAHEAR